MIKKRTLFFLIGDIILISLAVFLAFLLRFEWEIPGEHLLNLAGMIILALIFCPPVFYGLKLYAFSWSYVSASELVSLFKAVLLSFLFLAAALFLFRDSPIFLGFPRSTFFISFFLVFLFTGAVRFAKRIYLQVFQPKPKKVQERTLIVGAGDAGEQILRSILSSRTTQYLPVGFVDDSPQKQGISIHGFKVLGKISDIPHLVSSQNIEGMIIALPSSAGSRTIKKAAEVGREAGLKRIKIIPPVTEIIDGKVSIGNLKEPQIEDLLGREPVLLDFTSIEKFISGKSILVTGAAGSIGAELCRQIAKFEPSRLLLLDQDETGIFNIEQELKSEYKIPEEFSLEAIVADTQDKERIAHIFKDFAPEIVFHAAAYKHVPLMEENPEEAVKNNIFGTEIVAKAAIEQKAEKFIFISTDKCVNPTSVMGATKRIGEMICQSLNNGTKFISVRFGNVLDSRGSVIPIFREQIKKGGPVEVTHPEMKRYFMTTSEACLLVMEASTMGKGGEVFVLDMGKPIKILDLAKEMIRFSGLEPDKDISIVFTGIRPGEKLFEEVLTAEEGTVTTKSKKILKTKLSESDWYKLNSGLEKLKTAATASDKNAIIEILKELIPTYHPKLT